LPNAPAVDYPKLNYIQETFFKLVRFYIGLDISQHALQLIRPDTPFFSLALPNQILISWTTAFHSYLGIEFAYYVTALLSVSIGFYKPNDWPPITGSFRCNAYTVRKSTYLPLFPPPKTPLNLFQPNPPTHPTKQN